MTTWAIRCVKSYKKKLMKFIKKKKKELYLDYFEEVNVTIIKE